jgi:hypothetical protein
LLLTAALLFAVTMALLPQPPQVPIESDKFQHMLAFGSLTILSVLAFPRTPLLRIGERLSFLGAMIEVVQSIPALHRDCDIMDWVADTAVIAGVLLVVALSRRARASAISSRDAAPAWPAASASSASGRRSLIESQDGANDPTRRAPASDAQRADQPIEASRMPAEQG